MRALFTDGFNSVAHVAIGFAGALVPTLAVPGFVFYQVMSPDDPNLSPDLAEFVIGLAIGLVILVGFPHRHRFPRSL